MPWGNVPSVVCWDGVGQLLRTPKAQGCSGIGLVGREAFWNEDELPFRVFGGGAVLRIEPAAGFTKDALAATPDERRMLLDCLDARGWLVPAGLVAAWMTRHVSNPRLDDLLLSHPLYVHATEPDGEGRSRLPGPLVSWVPGVPTLANVAAPPFWPDDESAPAVNRKKPTYADAVVDLLGRLQKAFRPVEIEVGVQFAR